MDSLELKKEIKGILRKFCEENELEYFDSEDTVVDILLDDAKQNAETNIKEADEKAKMEREILARKRANQADLNHNAEHIK